MTTISFIGRKQNSSIWHKHKFRANDAIEKPRVKELEGLRKSKLSPMCDVKQADVVYVRLNPERTNKRHLKNIAKAEEQANSNALILNSVKHFQNYASKIATFELWKTNKIACPEFETWSPWLSKTKQLNNIKRLLQNSNGLYLRTHNEDSGKGIFFIQPSSTNACILKTINKLRIRALSNKVSKSQILAVKPVDNQDNQGIYHVYRAHIACNQLLGGYALVGTEKVIHASDQRKETREAFCAYNQKLQTLLGNPAYKQQILNAFAILKADIGAIEFFEINGQLIFLEMNPQWGGTHRYGNQDFMSWLKNNIDAQGLTLVKAWLEAEAYYQNFYNQIHHYKQSN